MKSRNIRNLETKIRKRIGEKVIITTSFNKELVGTLDNEITNKLFNENTMIYYRDENNMLCGVELKHIVDVYDDLRFEI